MKKEYTRTIFRKYKSGEIIALFPDLTYNDNFITCYVHLGQHSGADYKAVVSQTVSAKPSEFKALKSELESIGYNLIIRKVNHKNFCIHRSELK